MTYNVLQALAFACALWRYVDGDYVSMTTDADRNNDVAFGLALLERKCDSEYDSVVVDHIVTTLRLLLDAAGHCRALTIELSQPHP